MNQAGIELIPGAITDSQLTAILIGLEMDKGASMKEAIIKVVQTKLIGTYKLAVLEVKDPKEAFFLTNSGQFVAGVT